MVVVGRVLFCVGLVIASSAPSRARDEDLFVTAADLHTVLFGSVEAGRSSFVTAGVKTTPVTSLDRTGPVLLEQNGYGANVERVRADGVVLPALRITAKAAFLGGYQWSRDGLYLAAFAGPEVVDEQLTVAGRLLRVSQVRPGIQGQFELWADPLPAVNVNATVVVGSAQGSVWGRFAGGYRLTPDLQLGPEVATYLTETYRETRWGVHLTGIPIWTARLRLSGGWMNADDGRPGSPYLSLSAWLRM